MKPSKEDKPNETSYVGLRGSAAVRRYQAQMFYEGWEKKLV